jgi:hypothetical protein
LRGRAAPDDERDNEGEREHDRADGERNRDAVREEVVDVQRVGVGGGEDGDEGAEAEGPAELVGDVDQAGGGAGVFGGGTSGPTERSRTIPTYGVSEFIVNPRNPTASRTSPNT